MDSSSSTAEFVNSSAEFVNSSAEFFNSFAEFVNLNVVYHLDSRVCQLVPIYSQELIDNQMTISKENSANALPPNTSHLGQVSWKSSSYEQANDSCGEHIRSFTWLTSGLRSRTKARRKLLATDEPAEGKVRMSLLTKLARKMEAHLVQGGQTKQKPRTG